MENYLALESLIQSRIKDQVNGLQDIKAAADLEDVSQQNQITPAAYVIYAGDRIVDTPSGRAGLGAVQSVYQTWLVMVATRYRKAYKGPAEDAGRVLYDIIQALAGWDAGVDFPRPLRRVNAPKPEYLGGYGYFYLGFEAQLITH